MTPQERTRGGYKHRTIRATRPDDEQVELPARVAPPLVTPEIAQQIQDRMAINRQLASRNNRNPDATLLHGGFARCAYCGGALTLTNTWRHHADGTPASNYQCKRPLRAKGSCVTFSIKAHLLDAIVWESIRALLLDPSLITFELERAQADKSEDPARAALAAVDARLSEIERQRANVTKAITLLSDPDALGSLTEQLSDLARQHRMLSSERQIAALHAEQSARQEQALARIIDWAANVGRNVDALTMRERREVIAALGARVRVWKKEDRDPRIALDLHLPISGVLPVITESDGSTSVCVTTVTGKIQKFIMRQQSVEEWGLQQAAGVQTA